MALRGKYRTWHTTTAREMSSINWLGFHVRAEWSAVTRGAGAERRSGRDDEQVMVRGSGVKVESS